MPARAIPLINGETYHIVNHGASSSDIFTNSWDYQRFEKTFLYYQNATLPTRFSKFLKLPREEREKIWKDLRDKHDCLVEIIVYCLMPNHFHFLLKQLKENGIFHFIRRATNSYSHYFNLKHKRRGTLFASRFKAVHIDNDSRLLHVSRYIHLNPYSSFLVKNLSSLLEYLYSSLPEYLNRKKDNICGKEIILGFFKTLKDYQKFVFDRADYQRSLEEIKHQILE